MFAFTDFVQTVAAEVGLIKVFFVMLPGYCCIMGYLGYWELVQLHDLVLPM